MIKPVISVIIPYYDGARWLPLSAASVLRQKDVRLELIVVDDGSVSSGEPVAAELGDERVKFIRIAHTGKGAAVNLGIAQASGEFVCVLDQDDRMAAGRLAMQLEALAIHPEADAIYSDYERVTESDEPIDVFISRRASNREMLHAMASGTGLISMQTMVIRKKSLERLGGFSEDISLTGLEDGEFFARIIGSGANLHYAPGIAAQWVSHAANYSKGPEFQVARLKFLARLEALSAEYPLIRAELDHFRAHAYVMRGIYFLAHGEPGNAVSELKKALLARPFILNTYYLFLKAVILSRFKNVFYRL